MHALWFARSRWNNYCDHTRSRAGRCDFLNVKAWASRHLAHYAQADYTSDNNYYIIIIAVVDVIALSSVLSLFLARDRIERSAAPQFAERNPRRWRKMDPWLRISAGVYVFTHTCGARAVLRPSRILVNREYVLAAVKLLSTGIRW